MDISPVLEEERHSLTKISRSSWWRLDRAGLVPKSHNHLPTGGRKAWVRSELETWIVDHKKGWTPEEENIWKAWVAEQDRLA